ncbi:MAG: hypothetical protein DRH37_09945 [Deltaproteobacteria bacterium]|nr:MAG: hypothetical protein DRH37_09945 [Deltaproteobacteria bacterium]
MMNKETEALRRKVEELDNRTSSSALIGPGRKGYPHQEKALDDIAQKFAEDVGVEIENLKKKKRLIE